MWSGAVQVCDTSVAILKGDHIFEVVTAFGFPPVQSS